ncbi:hypothetical protein T05_9288 [Trichinella murrelli]|uniref:Uncharacterized protein n=1 Tax=Trichinella murrelli TaxID=144512 RepID=A0A0V0TST9_9BILA|nr:hypothetical protein T05_9288 [Trichinella murrelli]
MQGTITPWQAIPMTVSVPFTMGFKNKSSSAFVLKLQQWNCMHTVDVVDFIDKLSSDIAAHLGVDVTPRNP